MKRAARHFWDRQAGTRLQPEPARGAAIRLARGGFSLIEVVVALLIFVIGALAVIKIFPPGLGVVQNSQEVGVASNLSQSLVNSYTAMPDTVPYAIYFTAPAPTPTPNPNSLWNDYGSGVCAAKPTGTSMTDPLPTSIDESIVGPSALGQPNYISGERDTVQQADYIAPQATPVASPTPIPYVTTKFRYVESSPPVVYHEDNIRGVAIDGSGNLNFANATLASTGATFNAGGASANLPPTGGAVIGPGQYEAATPTHQYSTTYYVSYHWTDINSYLNRVLDEPLQYPTGGALPPVQATYITNAHVVPGPVAVHVRWVIFSLANTDGSHTGFIDLSSINSVATGMAYLPGTGLVQGNSVSVDYVPDDWRWLVEDNKPAEAPTINSTPTPWPTPGPTPFNNEASVFLPVGFLDPGQLLFTLLTTVTTGAGAPTTTTQASYWTGDDESGVGGGGTSDNTTTPALAYVIHKTGEVAFGPGLNVQARSRIVYQTLDGWARQPAVAARTYYPFISTGANVEPWRQYCLGNSTDTNIYFHPSEAGKTVAISFLNGSGQTILDETVPIQKDIVSGAQIPSDVPASFYSVSGAVAVATPFDIAGGQPVAPEAILGVRGLSITARTAWISNGDYTDVRVDGYRKVSTQ